MCTVMSCGFFCATLEFGYLTPSLCKEKRPLKSTVSQLLTNFIDFKVFLPWAHGRINSRHNIIQKEVTNGQTSIPVADIETARVRMPQDRQEAQ